jgi:hypothetical protein
LSRSINKIRRVATRKNPLGLSIRDTRRAYKKASRAFHIELATDADKYKCPCGCNINYVLKPKQYAEAHDGQCYP